MLGIQEDLVLKSPETCFSSVSLKAWTTLSASPLVEGWKGALSARLLVEGW